MVKVLPILCEGRVGASTRVFHVPSIIYDILSESLLELGGKMI